MMFFQETNSLLNEYLKVTGKPASSVSTDDYLKFRQCILNEYMMGVPTNGPSNVDEVSRTVWPTKKEEEAQLEQALKKSKKTTQATNKPTQNKKDTANSTESHNKTKDAILNEDDNEKDKKSRMMDMMRDIQG